VVVSANGALQRLLSRAEEEIVGRSIGESLPSAAQRTIADRWPAMLARGEGHGVQKLVVDRDVHTTVSYRLTSRTSGAMGSLRRADAGPGTGRRCRRVALAARAAGTARG
jgi:hypothetical protein